MMKLTQSNGSYWWRINEFDFLAKTPALVFKNELLKLDDLASPDDNTDLNANTSRHGLLPKLPGDTVNFLRADGTFAPATSGGGISDAPSDNKQYARKNAAWSEVLITDTKLDDLAAPDDNTDLDASTSKHGLMKKFPGGTVNFLREDGTFAPVSGSGLGDVTGPSSAVDGHLAVFDGTSGKIIKDGGAASGNPRLLFEDTCTSSSLPNGVTTSGSVNFDSSVVCRTISGSSSYETPNFAANYPLVFQVQCENTNYANTGDVLIDLYRGTTLLARLKLQTDYNDVLYDGALSPKGASGSSGSPKTGWRYKLSASIDSLGMTDGIIEGIAGGTVTTSRWTSNPSVALGDNIKLKISTSGTRSISATSGIAAAIVTFSG
jgi:hypothetical protein